MFFSSHAFSGNAWWVDFRYIPTSNTMFGVEAEKINKEFSHVEIFTCKSIKYFNPDQCKEVKRNNSKFELVGDFNNDGVQEIWNVGIAKLSNGNYAHTVIIRNEKSKNIEQVITVKVKQPRFSILSKYYGALKLFFCMECGDYAEIIWKNNKWVLKWPEPYG